MNNFEKACFDSCEKWINSIEVIAEPNYSQKHVKKMNSIANGNVRFNKRTVMILVACMLILALNIVAFAYIGSKQKSKDLIFYKSYPLQIGDFEMDSGIDVRVKGAEDYNEKKLFDDLQYGYVPEGYEDILIDQEENFNKLAWGYDGSKYKYFQRDFEKKEGDTVVGRITAIKVLESNELTVYNNVIYCDGDMSSDDAINDVLENRNTEEKSKDLYEIIERLQEHKENGIHYYFLPNEDELLTGGRLYWNYEGYLYELTSNTVSAEEMEKNGKRYKIIYFSVHFFLTFVVAGVVLTAVQAVKILCLSREH